MRTDGAPRIRWAWIFLDTPRADARRSWDFWAEVTGMRVADQRGEDGEFATLAAARGGSWVKLQAVGDGPGGVHLDLDVEDVHTAAASAESLGATRIGTIGRTVEILRSPGGFVHCLTTWHGEADQDRTGATSLLDQVCLDIPTGLWDTETAYWAALTGWPRREGRLPEFASLDAGSPMPLRLLLQRLGDEDGVVRGHVDLACADRAADTERHVAAGARVVDVHELWTVLTDPVGRVYCLTDRSPKRPV